MRFNFTPIDESTDEFHLTVITNEGSLVVWKDVHNKNAGDTVIPDESYS